MNTQCKVLFAGGCHVVGYPVGHQLGFASVALNYVRDQGIESEGRELGYLSFSKFNNLSEMCRHYDPTVLVLQVGNYESTPHVKRTLLKAVGLGTGRRYASESPSGSYVPNPTAVQRTSILWHTRMLAKKALDGALGHPFVNLNTQHERLDRFLSQVTDLQVPRVVVLSPLPCADPSALFYRQKIAYSFEVLAAKHGFDYVNTLTYFEECCAGLSQFDHFADAMHLNALGHQILGELVGHHLV